MRRRRIKILLASLPRMLRDVILGMIETEAEMESVGEVEDLSELTRAVAETEVHAVILGIQGGVRRDILECLLQHPGLTILSVAVDATQVTVEQMCPRSWQLQDPSGEEMLRALRRAVETPCEWETPCPHAKPIGIGLDDWRPAFRSLSPRPSTSRSAKTVMWKILDFGLAKLVALRVGCYPLPLRIVPLATERKRKRRDHA